MTKYIMYAHFNGDDEFEGTRSQRTIIETSLPTYRVTINEMEFTKNSVNIITGKITNTNGEGITHNNITIKITNPQGVLKTATIQANSSGVFSYDYTPTLDGDYTVLVIANATNTYNQAQAQINCICGQKNTVLSINTLTKTVISENQIILTCILEDANGESVKSVPVKLYRDGSVTPLQTVNTNSDGAVTFKTAIKEVGSHYFVASFEGNTKYKESTTGRNDCIIDILKHTITINPHDTILYPSWKLRFNAIDERGKNINSTGFTVSITGNGNNYTYTGTTDNTGTFETHALNLNVGKAHVTVTGGPWTYYERVESTFDVYIYGTINAEGIPNTISNVDVNIPYKQWVNLTNSTKEDGNVAKCGTICTNDVLAGKNGSRNTPATIHCNNHSFNVANIIQINKLELKVKCRTVSCSSSTAKPGITPPQVKLNNQLYNFIVETNDGQIPYNNLDWITCTLNNITTNNLSNLEYDIIFPKNSTSNPGIVEIDNIKCELEYTPIQED